MNQSQIAVVIGSIRRESYNRLLAGALKKLAPQEFTFNDLRIDDLPLYNQDLDGKQPEQVGRLKSAISSANGVIFVTPEYNRSIPGVLKNAIDHGSRRLDGQTGGRHRHIAGLGRHLHGATAPAEHFGVSGYADHGPAGSLPAIQRRFLRFQRRHS
jgi:chromate reductase